ncbi:MAG: class I SAM-dependent methyltransferase [Solirubrobacteraceae bacterium]
MDWGIGRYEDTAARLAPAAEVVVRYAALTGFERVLDVGCGTGNASLRAAERGCQVTGVDPAGRLLEVARERAAQHGLAASFVAGEAANLPVPDASADVVLSVFAVIFAPDVRAAAAEMARVSAPAGRVVLSAWVPDGAMHDCLKVFRQAISAAAGHSAPAASFAWHDHEALAELWRPHGFTLTVDEHLLPFTAASAREYLEADSRHHPQALAGRAALERSGDAEEVLERGVEILDAGNEDPSAFRVTSRYIVATATRAEARG